MLRSQENIFIYGYDDQFEEYCLSGIPELQGGAHIQLRVPNRSYQWKVIFKGTSAFRVRPLLLLICFFIKIVSTYSVVPTGRMQNVAEWTG